MSPGSPIAPPPSPAERAEAPAARSRRYGPRAFSLVELLVVMGLMVILAGGIAIALGGRGGAGPALTSSQQIVAGLVGAARAQAALHQTSARLVVYGQVPGTANADANKYLRSLVVVRQETLANGRTVWVAASDVVTLPAPVCVVPISPVPSTHLNTGVSWNNLVATGPVSTLEVDPNFDYRGQSNATVTQFFGVTGQRGRAFYLEFGPTGTVTLPRTSPLKIALTTAVFSANTVPKFTNANTVRGLFIRRTGGVSLVNRADAF